MTMPSLAAFRLCLRVGGAQREERLDLPALTSVHFDQNSFSFGNSDISQLIMRSAARQCESWLDLPKLAKLATDEDSYTFCYPHHVILEGVSSLPE